MADRGFTIHYELALDAKLVILGFKHKDKSQFSKEEVHTNKTISETRVHTEPAVKCIKQYRILATKMKF